MLKLFRLVIAEVPHYTRFYAYIRERHEAGELKAPEAEKATAVIMSLINQYFMLAPLYTGKDPIFDPEEVIDRAIANFMSIHGAS